jgi:isoleucyl-tRNA synthetase
VKLEHRILKFWEDTRAFEKLREMNRNGPRYSFQDGPITANNPMGVHHAWGRIYKDIFQRYKGMRGFHLRYQNGYDNQGLWIEVEVEKELGFNSKRDIEAYGIDRFVKKCKERTLRFSQVITEQSIRLGYWMDWDNSYYTISDENNYTIWYFLKKCHDNGWIYKGHDVMPWCYRCGTSLSEHEIATEGYQELTHPSLILRFPLLDREKESLLVWTTTPWTLTSNVAAAVNPEVEYAQVEQSGETFYLAKATLHQLQGDYRVVRELLGKELVGLCYHGPFDELQPQQGVVHTVIPWEEVGEEEGTGIVHIAPGCGKEDFELSKEYDLPAIAPLDEFGLFMQGFDWLTGRRADEVSNDIFDNLREKGLLYTTEDYTHRYPVCWRCRSPLVFRLVDEWFISMDQLRHQIMEVTKKITWMPAFGLDQELDWLRNMHDWCISKKRFWGLALPIYECECGHFDVFGGRDELRERAVEGWDRFEGHSPHRPWIDEVKVRCSQCGAAVQRIPDVGNPWLDAGIVPYSTLNYLTDRKHWETWFPPEFITECFPGQFRNWFYSLLAMSTVLENREPFLTVLGHALVRDEQGREMHKSWGNAIVFDDAAERMGVEVMRWMFARQNPYVNINFGYGPGFEIKRKLLTLWNCYGFFVTYAALDEIDPREDPVPVSERSILDQWILSKLNSLVKAAGQLMDGYSVAPLVKLLEDFFEDLSNWYIRRSRRRFWKSQSDTDKLAAYQTLYEVLTTTIVVMAPILPFLTEEMYQNLVRSIDPDAPESVHHQRYPDPDESLIDEELMRDMDLVVRLVSLGRSVRNTAQLKVRQPLSEFIVIPKEPWEAEALMRVEDQILDELNVKALRVEQDQKGLVSYSVKPNFKLLGPKYGSELSKVQKALAELDAASVAGKVEKGEPIGLDVDGTAVELTSDEVFVETHSREGLVVAEEGGYTVALETTLTEELRNEGYVREFIHRVQNMRKEAGFEVSDRIRIFYTASERLQSALLQSEDHICAETLCVEFVEGTDAGEFQQEHSVNGEPATISVERVTR